MDKDTVLKSDIHGLPMLCQEANLKQAKCKYEVLGAGDVGFTELSLTPRMDLQPLRPRLHLLSAKINSEAHREQTASPGPQS